MSRVSRPTQASMAAEPVSPEVATTIVARSLACRELVVEQPADDLQGHVLERQRRAPEELEQVQVVELDQRAHVGVVEGGVGIGDHGREVVAVDRPLDVRPHHVDRHRVVRAHLRPHLGAEGGPGLGHVEATVGGQAGEEDVAEAEDGGGAPGGHVSHEGAPCAEGAPLSSAAKLRFGVESIRCRRR